MTTRASAPDRLPELQAVASCTSEQARSSSIHWNEAGAAHSAPWRSENAAPAPQRVVVVDDRLSADAAYRFASQGTAMLWRGDFHNAKQLLQALARRIEGKAVKPVTSLGEAFNLHRLRQAQRAHALGMLLLHFEEGYRIDLRRAPDVQQACTQAHGPAGGCFVASLRELLGIIGAHEWRKTGIEIAALGARIHPHYGVFAPLRSDYIQLIADAPIPTTTLAWDIGTGTGVLAALLARRGVRSIVATDNDPRALACARENAAHLGYSDAIKVASADLFPTGRAPLIVCNPPWLPARANSALDRTVYDPNSRMLRGFLDGLVAHLEPHGEGWLLLSDLAEHLNLRPRAQLLDYFRTAGLDVASRTDIRPAHPRAADRSDPLHTARAAEVTSLWRLVPRTH